MKKSLLALFTAGVLLLCACAFEKENTNAPSDVQEEIVLTGMPEIGQLLGMKVINAANGEKEELSMMDSFEDHETIPLRYCIVDIDSDGQNETLVEFSDYGNTAIVRFYDGELYAYMIPFSERQELKTDGEMQWSMNDSYIGTQKAKFSGKEMELSVILESDFNEDVHYINGESVSYDKAIKEWDKFDAKENAEWDYVYEIPVQ